MKLKLILATLCLAASTTIPALAQNDNVGNGNVGFMNGNFNSNGNGGQGGTGGVGGGGGTGGQGGQATGNSVSNSYRNRVPGAIGAPGLAAGAITCLGSISGGVSFYGGGVGLGTTYLEKACESRALAEQLYRYGMKKQAIEVLWYNHPLIKATIRQGGLGGTKKR